MQQSKPIDCSHYKREIKDLLTWLSYGPVTSENSDT